MHDPHEIKSQQSTSLLQITVYFKRMSKCRPTYTHIKKITFFFNPYSLVPFMIFMCLTTEPMKHPYIVDKRNYED
jgi:hypothetical protein